jgi:hypothetical protein
MPSAYLFGNNPITAPTLASSYSSGGLSLTLNSTSNLPAWATATGRFGVVRVDDELFLVTNNNTGTGVLTVVGAQEGTSAANHSSGTKVYIYETEVTFAQLKKDVVEVGTWANRPTAYESLKRSYKPNNAYVQEIIHDPTGSQLMYVSPVGVFNHVVPALSAGSSLGTVGTYGAFTDLNGAVKIVNSDGSTELYHLWAHGLASAGPWTITLGFQYFNREVGNCDAGICIADGGNTSAKYIRCFMRAGQLYLEKFNSIGSFNSAYFQGANIGRDVNPMFVEINNDGTNINYKFGAAPDLLTPKVVYSHAKTNFTGAITHYGPYIASPSTDGEAIVKLIYAYPR